jgi:hypothetical protein
MTQRLCTIALRESRGHNQRMIMQNCINVNVALLSQKENERGKRKEERGRKMENAMEH